MGEVCATALTNGDHGQFAAAAHSMIVRRPAINRLKPLGFVPQRKLWRSAV